MDAEIVACGCAHAYQPIVTRHGEVLHDERHHRVLEQGDLVLADVGAEAGGPSLPSSWCARRSACSRATRSLSCHAAGSSIGSI